MYEISETQVKYLITKARKVGNTVAEYELLIQHVKIDMMRSQEHGTLGGTTAKKVVMGLLYSLKIQISEAVTIGDFFFLML